MSCACAKEPRHQLKLVNIIEHGSDTYSYDFEKTPVGEWSEGDSSKIFFQIGEKEVGKAFSYATLPSEPIVRFTTRIRPVRSDFKQMLSEVKIGETVEITYPKGDFKIQRLNRPIILLSNGVGIAATRALVKAFEADSDGIHSMTQINVDASGAIYEEEFEALMHENSKFKSLYVKHRAEFYEALKAKIIALWETVDETPLFYVVGSETFVKGTVTYLYEAGYNDGDVVLDGSGCGCSSGGGCGSKKVVSILTAMAV